MTSNRGEFKNALSASLAQVQAIVETETEKLQSVVSELQAENAELRKALQGARSARIPSPQGDAACGTNDSSSLEDRVPTSDGFARATSFTRKDDEPEPSSARTPRSFRDVSEPSSARCPRRALTIDTQMKIEDPRLGKGLRSEHQIEMNTGPRAMKGEGEFATGVSGYAQRIVKSSHFEVLTLIVILLNTLWISIDLDYNQADSLLTAAPVFVVADNAFCFFFTAELSLRFAAFTHKSECLRDAWFVSDSLLVLAMVLETWILTLVMLISENKPPGLSSVSIFRMMRLARVTRMAKLVRAMPEAMVVCLGLARSLRSVLVTAAMLLAIMYVFAVVFKQLLADTGMGNESYNSVPRGMLTLFFEGVVPDNTSMMNEFIDEGAMLGAVLFILFIGLATLTCLNLLVGFLCEVVSTTSRDEKEAAEIELMTSRLQSTLEQIDTNYDGRVSVEEIQGVLHNRDALKALQRVGIDVASLIQEVGMLVDDEGVDFEDFVSILLQFRVNQPATVGSVAGMRKSMLSGLGQIHKILRSIDVMLQCKLEEGVQRHDPPSVKSDRPLHESL